MLLWILRLAAHFLILELTVNKKVVHPQSILKHTESVGCDNFVLSNFFSWTCTQASSCWIADRSTDFLQTLCTSQAISQGIWAMARLGFKPSSHLLKTLASDVLYQIDKGNPMHRQAVANVFWSLAALDFPMNNTFYKQIMQTIMAHAYRFRNVHFGQVATPIRLNYPARQKLRSV